MLKYVKCVAPRRLVLGKENESSIIGVHASPNSRYSELTYSATNNSLLHKFKYLIILLPFSEWIIVKRNLC
jgi:hypothetical protein